MNKASVTRQAGGPPPDTVDSLMQQLLTDPDFVIEVMAYNNFPAVSARYNKATGKTASTPAQLTSALQSMRRSGDKSKVLYAISVPWEYKGNTALEQAVSALRSEAQALLTDPAFSGSPKNLPFNNFGIPNSDITSDGGAVPNEDEDASDTGRNSQFWNSLPGILTGLGGLVGAFTGNNASTSAAGSAPPPTRSTNWVTVILVVLGVAALITGVVLWNRTKKG